MLILGKFEGMMVRDKFCRQIGSLGTQFFFYTLTNKQTKKWKLKAYNCACKLSYLAISRWLRFSKTKEGSFGLKFHLLQCLLTLLLDNPTREGTCLL